MKFDVQHKRVTTFEDKAFRILLKHYMPNKFHSI